VSTFDPSVFGAPTSDSHTTSMVLGFAAIAMLADLFFTLVVAKEAAERQANVLGWSLVTLLFPLVGYLIWKASVSREDHPPDMSLIHRELRRARPQPPRPAPVARTRRRRRNFF
jgi:hypothetical protein